jgi:hypothetical protein
MTYIRELEKVQKRAAIVCGVYKNFVYDEVKNKYEYPSVTKMVQELGWLPLVTRRQVSRLVNFHRVVHVHGQMGWASVPGVSRGVYHGRGNHKLKVERVGSRRDVGKYSFANRAGREWNSLPQEVEKRGHFRSAIINRYTDTCWSAGSAV